MLRFTILFSVCFHVFFGPWILFADEPKKDRDMPSFEAAAKLSTVVDKIADYVATVTKDNDTQIVWICDQSGSLSPLRKDVKQAIKRFYERPNIAEIVKDGDGHRLATSVVAFGEKVSILNKAPLLKPAEIQDTLAKIEVDSTGVERVFTAVYMSASKFKIYREKKDANGEPLRNVVLIVFVDESGDDQSGLDQTIQMCRRHGMPVFVVGVPAPFGSKTVEEKFVDPDPKFDQTPQWAKLNVGPESFMPERISVVLDGSDTTLDPIDSGFGPFSLSSLCAQTGGTYFAVHPFRKRLMGPLPKDETPTGWGYYANFFDPKAMAKYQPDYVSGTQYMKSVASNKTRAALVRATKMASVMKLPTLDTKFPLKDGAELVAELTKAQKDAARLEPQLQQLRALLALGDKTREEEKSPRWQAGFDLAMGQVLAATARVQSYNASLAIAKRGMKAEDAAANTWVLEPSDDRFPSSTIKRLADLANTRLQKVVNDHPGTPWAYVAKQELTRPMGWTWKNIVADKPTPKKRRAPKL